jgi:hypothetical protein
MIIDQIMNENNQFYTVSSVLKFLKPFGVLPKEFKYAALFGVMVRVINELLDSYLDSAKMSSLILSLFW